jgi:hypothetical protein
MLQAFLNPKIGNQYNIENTIGKEEQTVWLFGDGGGYLHWTCRTA